MNQYFNRFFFFFFFFFRSWFQLIHTYPKPKKKKELKILIDIKKWHFPGNLKNDVFKLKGTLMCPKVPI